MTVGTRAPFLEKLIQHDDIGNAVTNSSRFDGSARVPIAIIVSPVVPMILRKKSIQKVPGLGSGPT